VVTPAQRRLTNAAKGPRGDAIRAVTSKYFAQHRAP
jgi:hypothetical protein